MRRTFYWKRLLVVVVAALTGCGTVFAVHHFQVRSQASILKEHAERVAAEADANPSKRAEAIELLQKYLKFQPADEGAFQTFANLLFEEQKADPTLNNTEKTARGVEEFLRAFPDHHAERRKLAELYLGTNQVGKLQLAKQHLEILFDTPNSTYRADVETRELASECEFGLRNIPAAIAHLEGAIQTGTAPVRTYVRIMEFHNANKEDAKRTTHIFEHLRQLRSGRFQDDLDARVAAARFELALKMIEPAREDMNYAKKHLRAEENPDALLVLAQLEFAGLNELSPEQLQSRHNTAEQLLKRAYALDKPSAKKNTAVEIMYAEVLWVQNQRDAGIQVLKETAGSLEKVNDEYFKVIDRLIDFGESEFTSQQVETKLATDDSKKVFVTYFRGRLAVVKQDWMTAIQLLNEATPFLVRVPQFHKKALVGLGTSYAALQNPDKQLEYHQSALRDDGDFPPALVGEAEAFLRMGNLKEALPRFRILVFKHNLTSYRPELVRLELLNVLGQASVASRNWKDFDASLGPVEARTPEIHIHQAESLASRGHSAEAISILENWLKAHPTDAKASAVWVTLARVKCGGKPDDALPVLAEAEKAQGDTVDFRLARAGLLASRAKPALATEFEALTAGGEKFSTSERFRLLFGLAHAVVRVADREEGESSKAFRETALKLLQAAAVLSPRDLAVRTHILDQGVALGLVDVVNKALDEMAAVEGPNGPVHSLARIALELPTVSKLTDPTARATSLRELRALAQQVRELRPGWSRVYIALAKLDELEGLNDSALANYVEALDKGDRQEYMIRRIVDLYRLKQQDEAAIGRLDKLSTEVQLPDDLERYRAIYRMLRNDTGIPRESRPTIDRIAPAGSTDYRMQLLRGSLLAAIRHDGDAERVFRRAVELADKRPETWASLVSQLIKVGKLADAKRAVTEAEKKLTAATPQKVEDLIDLNLALGALHKMIGAFKESLAYYNAACEVAPLELEPTRQRILFLQQTGQPEKALALLKQAKDSTAPNIARWARRYLAITMMTRPDAYNIRAQALDLIQQNLAVAPDDPEDLKARAVIWTADPVTREEGIRTLRHHADQNALTPSEFYLLGLLYFDQGKYFDARDQFHAAARLRPGVAPEHIAAVVRVNLALNLLDDAADSVERLKTHHPNSWEAVCEEARLLTRMYKVKQAQAVKPSEFADARKHLEKAREVIRQYPQWDDITNLAQRTGPLFEEIGLSADAEAAYKKILENDPSPAPHFQLARFYVVQKQSEKAIQLARDREKVAPPVLTAGLLTNAVRAKRPGAKTEAEIETWIDAALRDAAGKPELEAALIGTKAELLDAQDKHADAIKEYKRSLSKSKNDVVVNNLCMLLALHSPEHAEEAIKLMTELISLRGPVSAYLDTRAVACLVSSRPELATRDLKMALVQYDRAAYHFHLAWAFDLDGDTQRRNQAADELRAAKRLGLTVSDLHPLEQKRYLELLEKYKVE